MMRSLFLAALAVLLLMPLQAVETETWRQASFEEFQQAKRERVALRSDGLLTLSPEQKELLDSSADAIWALAADRKGNLYTVAASAQGGKLQLYRIPAGGGKAESIAEFDGLACFALAVDAQDRVYAGVSPSAKIYRVTGTSLETFSELPAAYVWAMAFDSKQNLYAATGDKGVIYRLDGSGKATVFAETEETHVRSLLVDGKDEVYAGTAPGGLVLRLSATGQPFVMYQAGREEISALAKTAGGDLFLASVGSKRSAIPRLPAAPVQTLAPQPAPAAPAAQAQGTAGNPPPRPATPATPVRPALAGGAEIIRIGADGFPETVWESERDIVYALAADPDGRVIAGTGNSGNLVRLEANRLHTYLLQAQAEQITAVLPMPGGALVYATANIGKVHQAGPALATDGFIESDVFDSEFFARWGKLSAEGVAEGDAIQLKVRSGNVNRPQKTWSEWSNAVGIGAGNSVNVPAARYVQWRADFRRASKAPELRAVELAYRGKNLPPRITVTEATPPNYAFPARTLSISVSDKLTLQPLSPKARPRSTMLPVTGAGSLSMNHSKGHVGVRWLAEDANHDELCYSLEIRPVGASTWLQLVKDLSEPQYSWDSNSWPDGRYEVRITASDEESNVPEEALKTSTITDAFTIDNTKPEIRDLSAKWSGQQLEVVWTAADGRSPVRKAFYSLNGQDWTRAEPDNGLSDALSLRYTLRVPGSASADLAVGSVIAIRVADEFENEAVASVAIPER